MSKIDNLNTIAREQIKIKEFYKDLSIDLNKNITISSLSEAKEYLEKLRKLMEYYSGNLEDVGQVKKYLYDQLTVGSDSQYSEKLHFIYELIQNVDDCDYEDSTDCNLTLCFNSQNNTITLEYNERGFTTENVFAISSIANSSKNKKGSQMKIGEKGIGFKSVFGIAKKVLIQSGYFSFSFNTNDFIVPIAEYENYNYVHGTKLTLYLSDNEVNILFNEILNKYNHGKNIGLYLNDNPVIFLNNLTKITYKNEKDNYISFGISRSTISNKKFNVEDNINILIEKKIDKTHEKFDLDYYRFSKEIIYNRQECKSRYPDSDFNSKTHKIIAIALKNYNFKGSVYSFLPTKVRTNVPIIFHVPFKLKASREDIDDQNENEWFTKTMEELISFTKEMYT